MKHGIAKISIIPIRKEPSEKSEMVSQLLFGELFKIVYENDAWCKIETEYDNYSGWIDRKMCSYISDELYNTYKNKEKSYSSSIIGSSVSQADNSKVNLVPGSVFYNYNNKKNSFVQDGVDYFFDGMVFEPKGETRENLINLANSFLGSPYLWGGRTPFGIDCSGFTQLVYKLNGIFLPRDASQQIELGRTLNFLNEAHPGDLAFFDNDEGIITHVGMIYGANKIIHASGIVRIDVVDHQGIFNTSIRKYTHKLRVLKSMF